MGVGRCKWFLRTKCVKSCVFLNAALCHASVQCELRASADAAGAHTEEQVDNCATVSWTKKYKKKKKQKHKKKLIAQLQQVLAPAAGHKKTLKELNLSQTLESLKWKPPGVE